VSELCEQHKINPSLFYQWQRTFFENGARAFEGPGEYRLTLRAEPAFNDSAQPITEDERAQLAERKNAHLQRAITATVEVALLGSLCAIYFLATRAPRKELTTKCQALF
jgi:transposase-like protein